MRKYIYNTHTLPNGLRIIHLPTDREVVYCGYAVKAGSRNEKKGEEGIAHFCEHMTFKGTQHLTSLQIINKLELVGGELNAFTTKEDTFYYAAVLCQHFNRAVDLLTEMVFHSVYPQHEIDKEKEVVCDEIESYRDSPAELIFDEIENHIFSSHPLGHNVLGDSENVRSFTTENCKDFTRRYYRPDNAVFYVMGNIDFDKLIRRLESIVTVETLLTDSDAADEQKTAIPSVITPKITEPNELIEDLGTHQAHVMQAMIITEDRQKWRIPLFVVNNILGGPTMNSRLNLSLRERRGLVYTVESTMQPYSDAILWSVYFGCDSHDVKRCRHLVQSELSRLSKRELSTSVLNNAKRQLKGQLALVEENAENYAIGMAKQYLHYGTLKNTVSLCEKIDAVMPQDIHELAQRYMCPERFFTLIYK